MDRTIELFIKGLELSNPHIKVYNDVVYSGVNVYDYQICFNTHLSLPPDVMLSMSINKYLRMKNF